MPLQPLSLPLAECASDDRLTLSPSRAKWAHGMSTPVAVHECLYTHLCSPSVSLQPFPLPRGMGRRVSASAKKRTIEISMIQSKAAQWPRSCAASLSADCCAHACASVVSVFIRISGCDAHRDTRLGTASRSYTCSIKDTQLATPQCQKLSVIGGVHAQLLNDGALSSQPCTYSSPVRLQAARVVRGN